MVGFLERRHNLVSVSLNFFLLAPGEGCLVASSHCRLGGYPQNDGKTCPNGDSWGGGEVRGIQLKLREAVPEVGMNQKLWTARQANVRKAT